MLSQAPTRVPFCLLYRCSAWHGERTFTNPNVPALARLHADQIPLPPVTDTEAPPRRISTANIVGLGLAAAGLFVLVLAVVSARWYDLGYQVSDINHLFDVLSKHPAAIDPKGVSTNGWAVAYFGWGAWVVLLVAGLLALLANTPPLLSRLPGVVRQVAAGVAALLALLGLAWTFLAVNLFDLHSARDDGYGDWLGHAHFGFWAALVGYVLIAAGAIIGALVRPLQQPPEPPAEA